ncbi:M28 family peptidase [Chryseolinea lacunae]|uniref:M28 family peptidase n=1 Tax=Chryseolinea lacunae TaxID=2801331 RepID=A0ABS1L2I3_9BACT|nr:M28 family peptidase [Chryseolinea lacunae]MBL0744756.1 M28 family peptidase [Chryseolinea lacunae]
MTLTRTALFLTAFMLTSLATIGQKKIVQAVTRTVTAQDAEAHLTFLASDEMRGRDTGSPELDIAANYIVAQFRSNGIGHVPGASGYFQEFSLEKIVPPATGSFSIGAESFPWKNEVLALNGVGASLQGDIVFVGYGLPKDFDTYDVRGKIALALVGSPESTKPVRALVKDSPEKNKLAAAHGAVALVEVMTIPGIPWPVLMNYLSADRFVVKNNEEASLPHLLLRNSESASLKALLESRHAKAALDVKGTALKTVKAKNIAAAIKGSDATLSQQWVVISAHYDHVGVKKNASGDSIYNGARDNAIGAVALLEAARFLKQHPPKRSVLLLAVTAEEKGLLGSDWYANHPLIPLKQTVFNYNCDGGGYNDKSIVTIIDVNRTTTDEQLREACKAFGLTLGGDPAPQQNLFDRSDNANFAIKGVPALNISPGVKAFDEELLKYYHQPPDEVGSLDMVYLEKFYRIFVYGIYKIANESALPRWVKGDKYEEAGKALYGR